VTGAGSGIGAALSAALRDAGATVVDTDLRGAAVVLDVRDAGAFEGVVQDVVDRHGRIDFLVNNAGLAIGGDAELADREHWERLVDVNIRGVLHGTVAAYPKMLEQGRGRIVNMASLAGLVPVPLLTGYAMTKHAIVGLSLSLALEAAPRGVGIHVVCPAAVDTPLLDSRGPADLPDRWGGYDARRYLSAVSKPYPVTRLADDVLAGLRRGRAVIPIPRSAGAIWRVYRLSPWLYNRVMARHVARERQAATDWASEGGQ
jgi:NAD(P)-dependent dehydrogenase (short-subunit alcohol dehydrogenase family)